MAGDEWQGKAVNGNRVCCGEMRSRMNGWRRLDSATARSASGGLILLGGNDGRGREMIYSGTAAGGPKVRGHGSIAGATYW
jgi:hypothetical protein